MKQPKFISGPPGTGKTSMFITQKYTELLKKYSYNRIIILSHTNVAADEIRDEILKLSEMQGVTKKSMKYNICTIHAYCKSRLVGRKEVFSYEDHMNLTTIMSQSFQRSYSLAYSLPSTVRSVAQTYLHPK